MKPLLETSDPKYLKRLVRELNRVGSIDGFYASVATFKVRCFRARLRGGHMQVRSHATHPEWFAPSSNRDFEDAYARPIVASRRQ